MKVMNMEKKKYEILLIEKRENSILIYGEWMEGSRKVRGLICKVYCLGGLYIRCHACTGKILGTHTSLRALKNYLTGHA